MNVPQFHGGEAVLCVSNWESYASIPIKEGHMPKPRVLLADDHLVFAHGLVALLRDDFELVGLARDGYELMDLATKLRPDVIVADISMPSLNGMEGVCQLRSQGV